MYILDNLTLLHQLYYLMLQEDNKFLEDFFINLCDEETSPERKGQLVQFLKELCSLAQPMQHVSREEFFKVIILYTSFWENLFIYSTLRITCLIRIHKGHTMAGNLSQLLPITAVLYLQHDMISQTKILTQLLQQKHRHPGS